METMRYMQLQKKGRRIDRGFWRLRTLLSRISHKWKVVCFSANRHDMFPRVRLVVPVGQRVSRLGLDLGKN